MYDYVFFIFISILKIDWTYFAYHYNFQINVKEMVDFYIGGMTNVASKSLRSLLERKAFSSMDDILQVSA